MREALLLFYTQDTKILSEFQKATEPANVRAGMWPLGRLAPQAKLLTITVCHLWGEVCWVGGDTGGQGQHKRRAWPKYSLGWFMIFVKRLYSVIHYSDPEYLILNIPLLVSALEREQSSRIDDRTKHKPKVPEKKGKSCLGEVNRNWVHRLREVISPVVFCDTTHIGDVKCSASSFRGCSGQVVPLREI